MIKADRMSTARSARGLAMRERRWEGVGAGLPVAQVERHDQAEINLRPSTKEGSWIPFPVRRR